MGRCASRCIGSSSNRAGRRSPRRSPNRCTAPRPRSRTLCGGLPTPTSWFWHREPPTSGWRIRCPHSRPCSRSRQPAGRGSPTACGTRSGRSPCWVGPVRFVHGALTVGSGSRCRCRKTGSPQGRESSTLRCRPRVVGRHRIQLSEHAPLPVGRACGAVVPDTWHRHRGDRDAGAGVAARPCVVRGPPLTGLAAPHARRGERSLRTSRPYRRLLEPDPIGAPTPESVGHHGSLRQACSLSVDSTRWVGAPWTAGIRPSRPA